ncbi:MAG: T9SS type A sorting domain-containing protein [Saprospiraceae bacterium]|nr:T9SS type A sorting domain-containing protein [Saprospiraceae bacterium]
MTITGGGCTATACYTYQMVNNFNISGYLYFPDSLNNPGPMQGVVELFFNSPNSNVWEPIGTVNIQSDPAGWSNYYDFGQQTNAGNYIVKATLDPNSPGASGYMPTYHFSTVHWDEADLITLPSAGFGLFNIILNDGSNLTGGSGNINGTVTQGDGFTANDEGDRGGDPRPNTSVLLFDSNELPITHTLTDEQGQYNFSGLPFGTYKLEVEIVGMEQAVRWVTLSADNPTSSGNDFEVTDEGIVLGINELLAGSGLEVSPNPTSGDLNIWLEANNNFEAKISIARLDGTTVLIENQQVVKGGQSIMLDLASLPTGLYLLQVTTGKGVVAAKVVKQ